MSVVVLGMHRSGTSAATRVVNLLGVPTCRPADLLRGHQGNERGHWECTPLVVENERLMQALGARWWCPPDGVAQVAGLAEDEGTVERCRAAFAASHPTPQWVWKDPRLCFLLPFWRQVLPRRPVALLVHRHPAEVAASLASRNRISPRFGLALWERYVVLATQGAHGLPTLVCRYADLVADPVAWAGRVAGFLADNGVDARLPAVTAGIEAFVTARLRHTTAPADITAEMTPAQRRWHDHLERLSRGEPGDAGPEPEPGIGQDAVELMREVRVAFGLTPGDGRAVRAPGPLSNGMTVTDPVRTARRRRPAARSGVSVLLLPGGRAATAAEVRRLAPRLPAGADLITVATPDDAPAEAADGAVPNLLVARRDHPMSLAERLNLAAELARGELLVVLAGAPVTPRRGWLPALRRTLEQRRDCAVAAPVLRGADGAQHAHGLTTDPWFVDVGWHTEEPAPAAPFPVRSASATAFVTTRRQLAAVGGFDPGLTGAGREDLDLCLRLWRAGWTCLAVPAATVTVDFETPDATESELLTNILRLGVVHLGPDRLREQVEWLSGCASFPEALSRVTAGDAGLRRSVVAALSWYRTGDLAGTGVWPAG